MIRNVTKVQCTMVAMAPHCQVNMVDAQPGEVASVTLQFCKPSYSSYVKNTIVIQYNVGGYPTTSVGLIMELTSQNKEAPCSCPNLNIMHNVHTDGGSLD